MDANGYAGLAVGAYPDSIPIGLFTLVDMGNPPDGKPFPVQLRGFVQGSEIQLLSAVVGAAPFKQTEWPNPRGRDWLGRFCRGGR